jgi:DNA-binding HxlR family transcriptional regulator
MSLSQQGTIAPVVLSSCPVERAIQVIGGKWKLLVLRSLLLNGPQGYNELLASVSSISSKELTRNLEDLTSVKLVERTRETTGRLTPYSLTKAGEELMPTFKSLLAWGEANLFKPEA